MNAVVRWGVLAVSVLAAGMLSAAEAEGVARMSPSIREFGVLPGNTAETNRQNLQKAIDWASPRGGALFVEPTDEPYPMASGVILRANVSLLGVHGPVGRGTRHPDKPQPVGSVFRIEDDKAAFLTVESSTQVRGVQFWYPNQTLSDPARIIPYPPTIRTSPEKAVFGVTLSCLSFYGEYFAMDFASPQICEQLLFEHCYGYSLSGRFIRIDKCYDIPRILHCHINPANLRCFRGDYAKAVIDAVVAQRTFAYDLDHTDNAQVVDAFTFGTWGGIRLGPATYGQLTNFNFDCVAVGILKQGDGDFNRNWMVGQGSIIANTGGKIEEIHPILVEGRGHLALSNVEAFSGGNGALTCVGKSQDFLLVRGDQRVSVSLANCRMRNYAADQPLTVQNPQALIQAVACIDKALQPFNLLPGK